MSLWSSNNVLQLLQTRGWLLLCLMLAFSVIHSQIMSLQTLSPAWSTPSIRQFSQFTVLWRHAIIIFGNRKMCKIDILKQGTTISLSPHPLAQTHHSSSFLNMVQKPFLCHFPGDMSKPFPSLYQWLKTFPLHIWSINLFLYFLWTHAF